MDEYVTEVEQFDPGKFNIYPNPTSYNLIVESVSDLSGASIIISDLSGRVVLSQVLNGANNSISLYRLPNGMYHYSLNSKGELVRGRFIKE